jgi:hypothetical protein
MGRTTHRRREIGSTPHIGVDVDLVTGRRTNLPAG